MCHVHNNSIAAIGWDVPVLWTDLYMKDAYTNVLIIYPLYIYCNFD